LEASDEEGHEGMADNGSGERRSGGDGRTLTAVAERVAIVETRLDGLKEDTVTIRRSMHEMASQAQHVIAGLHALQQADAAAAARHEAAQADRRRLEEAMEAHRRDALAIQAENVAAAAAIRVEFVAIHDKFQGRINDIVWWLIRGLVAIMIGLFAIMGYLLTKGLPWEHLAK